MYAVINCTKHTHNALYSETCLNKIASFQKEAMRTQVALYFFDEVKFV